MSWTYQNEIIETLPEECIGFVYLITNVISGRKYIGKKLAKFSKTSYKVVKLKNGDKKKKKIYFNSGNTFCTIETIGKFDCNYYFSLESNGLFWQDEETWENS